MHTTQKTFGPYPEAETFILTIKANGGSVIIAVQHDPGVFIDAEVLAGDQVRELRPGRSVFRITPVGGAEFNLV